MFAVLRVVSIQDKSAIICFDVAFHNGHCLMLHLGVANKTQLQMYFGTLHSQWELDIIFEAPTFTI